MDDFRKKFFITISGFHLGTIIEDNFNDVIGKEVLEEFLAKENVLTLCASLTDDQKQIRFYTEVSISHDRLLVFYKIRPCILTDENIPVLVQIASVNGSPTAALYHTLYNVFTPLLVKQEKRSASHNSIQRQIANLQAGLRNAVLTPGIDSDPLQNVDNDTLAVILSLDHELDYWNNVFNSSRGKEQRTAAAFKEILQPLARDFSVLDALPLSDIEDLLENAHNILDDLWRHEPPYPKARIQHLMDLIAGDVIKCVSKNLTGVNVWSKNFNEASELLEQCISVLRHWETSCKQLTQIFWPNYSLHAWTGEPYIPQNLLDLINRLQEILSARTMHRQLVRLLTASEEKDLNTQDMFKPFMELDILECGPYTEPTWKTANKKFEYLLQPAEQLVAVKLKTQLSSINANTRQLLHEFSRYSELISRPVVKQALQTERQFLLSSLNDYVNQLASQLTAEVPVLFTKYDTPQVVNEIVVTRQLESKAMDIQKISEKLLNDLSGNSELNQKVTQLLKDIKQQHNELFESWTSEITAKIKDKSLSLRETDPVVQFSASKMMRVNYSAQLVTLIREVRQLSALGYRIPNNIQEISNHAKQFVTHAKILEQIANFHNTIGDRMIPSQRPMMLASALELSKLVQEQEVVSWGDMKSVEKYVENLKAAVEKLSEQNTFLASYHLQITDKIRMLEDTDLIKYYQKWKETTRNMRDMISQVEQKGFKSMQSWKVDIDQHLAKVLEIQYLRSLDTLHLYLPEIHADLVYRDSELQFSPNKETLREKYQQQLKKFLDIPKSFRGVSDYIEGNIFANIIEKNKDQLSKVNTNTDELFEQLNSVVRHWQSWLSLGTLDTTQLASWEHWDLHFRASKTFGQEIAKLPSAEERVGCFIIGLSWLRSDLESHNRSYWSQLVLSLKDSIAQDVFKLQQYVDTSTATLNRQPLTLDQIGEADASHADVLRQKPEMEDLYKEMMRKSQILASWTRERVDSVNRLQAAWERLQSLLDNYEHIIAKQVETMKTTLNIASENLQNDIERFIAKWEQVRPRPHSGQLSDGSLNELQKHLENIKEKRQQLDEIAGRKEKLLSDFARFNVNKPEFLTFDEIENDVKREENMWTLFEEFSGELEKLKNEEWIVFRKKVYFLEEFLSNWQAKLDKSENTPLITRMLQEVRKYQDAVPVLKYVRGEDFTEKHWMEVFTLLGITPKPIDILYVGDFLNVSDVMVNYAKELQVICKRSASEIVVRQALAELDQWDVQSRFILTSHTDSRGKTIMLIKDFKEILNKIGDNQSLLQSVKNSADYESFSERAELWESRLVDLDQYLTSLAQIQRNFRMGLQDTLDRQRNYEFRYYALLNSLTFSKQINFDGVRASGIDRNRGQWIYLEPIFGGGTLGQEKSRFDRIDKDFRYLTSYIEKDPRVTALCRYPNLRSILENLHDQLSRCQNSLDNFLAEKRNKFPRFLFLGDDDLLEVIGQSSKEQVIQAHLKKLFSGIHSINLDGSGKYINAICSLQGEIVPLGRAVDINQPVEDWLNVLVKEMQKSLKELLVRCLADGQTADPLKYPSQILCLADSITFTSKCEHAIGNMTLPPLLANYKAQLNHYSSLEFNESSYNSLPLSEDDGDTNVLELKLKALLLDTIHHIIVIEDLIQANVVKATDWNWQKQLRYYSDSSGNVTIKMVNSTMEYSYEYLGNQPKLVRTPLTDKCFLTLTQGMHLGMGGNPYGPAGTGKTESVKALGSLLGRQVLVFNCDEGIDAAAMGRILSGLVRSGAWGCFDEFNRLDEATLSAVSMHIQPIQNALSQSRNTLTLLDQEIQVNKHCGIFITLNPAGGGYGGRNKLPDSLKQLFRPVVMTHPDHEQIATTLLHCDGYRNVNVIGRKLVEIFSCASKLLSKQQHYDWGLRSLRTVLSGCGQNIRHFRKRMESSENLALQTELELVVKALRMDTLSKLTYSDSIKFDGLVRDIFPGIAFEASGHELLISALEESCADLGIQVNKRQIDKCIELYEQLKQRMGVALVGPPSSGKSSLRNLLFNALSKTDKTLKQHVFNPKSMPRNQLLGQIDLDTRQWTDGVLTIYSLQTTAESLDVWSWIVCDGDVDPEWVESLNSVLDDNKLLSLPSGWRIQFGPNVNFIFETHDLSYASPATISRLGIVFLSEEDMNIGNFVTNFISEQPEHAQGVIGHYVQDYFFKGVDWISTEGEMAMIFSKVSLASTGLSHLQGVTSKAQFTVGLLNGLGGCLTYQERELFAQQVFEWTGEMQPPSSIFYYYDKDRDIIDTYTNTISTTIIEIPTNDLPLIMSAQVCYILDCLKTWLSPGSEQHFLIVGPHGSAKSLILEHLVNERTDIEMVTIYCSASLSPRHVVQKLSQCCMIVSSNKGRIYKPKKGHLVLHLKNMHLLKCDQWGTNMLVSFLQQLITYKGLFDSSLDWVGIENITIVGSLITLNGLSPRFISVVHVFNISSPQPEELNIIFTSYLLSLIKKCLTNSSGWSSNKTVKLVTSMISVYDEITNNFNSVQEQHYNFSPHDLTKWCKSIFRYKNENGLDIEEFLLEILFYEAQRIFKDRLVNENDKNKMDAIINSVLRNTWNKMNLLKTIETCFYVPTPQFTSSPVILSLSKLNSNEWTDTLKRGIMLYEREGEDLNILIIEEFLNLTSRICKALTEPGGNLLLIGRSGVGRRSSVKVVSALQSVNLITPITTNQPQFNADLKNAMQHAGLEGEEVYLLLEDHILEKQGVIDIVNILLCSGEVPGLYTTSEIDSLVAGLKDEAGRENYEGNLYEFFIERIKKRLHVVICLECNNSNLSKILENCPALYQKCNVIWLSEWSENTMKSMPQMLTENANKEESNKNNKIEIADGFLDIHNLVKSEVTSPYRFVSLIKTYLKIYFDKKKVITNKQNKLQLGVSKLTDARNIVTKLKSNATEQQEKLAEKQAKANAALDMISNTMKSANSQKQEMEVLKHHTEKESFQLAKRKKEIEAELSEVKPLIEEARAAVGNIKTEALSEIRSLRAPPDVIRDILEGVLRLMGTQDTSWNSMKNFLSKRGIKEDIKSFDASRISPENRQAVERLMATRSDSFDPKNARRASVAAAPLAAWVTANVRYSLVLDKIKPLEREQHKLKQNLTNAELQLEELSTGLSDVDTAVTKLKLQLSTYTKEAAEIEIHLQAAQETLATAEGLVDKLNDEYERWQKQLKELSEELKMLPNNCLLAAAFIIYLSVESEDDRMYLLDEWMKMLRINQLTYNFSLEEFLSSEREQLQWQSEGLSADQLSLQNAIIILQSKICSLLLDPTSVASEWIKTHLKQKTVEVVSQNSPKFNTALELAIRFGKFLIIEEIENISPVLFPILRNQFVYQGERKLININGKLIDYHSDFQLVMCCRNVHLKLTADVAAAVNVVNFITTRGGLAEQLLTSAIKQESPDLEDRRKDLLRQREELQEKQQNLQDRLLEDLANATGDILQNKNLMTSLNETKASSNAISAALIESEEVHKKLQEEYNVYKDISEFGSALYFAAKEFSNVNVLYTLSVPAYIRFFLKSLPPLEDTKSNIGFLQRSLIQALYAFMSRGIFKADRLKFALHLSHKMLPRQIPEDEWSLFLGQSFTANRPDTSKASESLPSWIPDYSIQNIHSLQSTFPNLYNSLQFSNDVLWRGFMEKSDCETNFPSHCQLTEFQKVLVVQALRSDRLHSALLQCIFHLTGLRSLNPEILQLSTIFKETSSSEPILLLSTSGTDPSTEIKDLASSKIGDEKYIEIAMGEGQEGKALSALNEAANLGHWLILKNLHLVTSWLPVLCQNLQGLSLNRNFRLWLITESHSLFSPVLAQNCLKIAYEVPQGVKNNLLRTYSSWGAAYVEKLNPTSSRMFFILACVHALLQERRTYIPLGWSKMYEFSDVDLSTAVRLAVELWQSQNMHVPWKYLIGLCSDAIYGGRIENIQDLVILESYLRQYFVDEVLSHRWKPLGSNVSLPTYSNFEEYINVIKQLSDRDLPFYFGLPENIDRAWERNVALDVISQLRGLNIIKSKTEKFVREEWHKKLTPFMTLWKKLNQGHDYIRMTAPTPTTEGSSLAIFISEEYCAAILLIQQIHKCFATLNKISKGNIVAEDKDLVFADSLLCHQTPKLWQNIWKGPKDPSKYLKSVMYKTANIARWRNEQSADAILKQPINLSFLLHPETFLAAFKQDFSRKTGTPMDELILKSTWKQPESSNTITITGLLIEGALFDGYTLSPCLANSDSISTAPSCYLSWVQKQNLIENDKLIEVPLYYSSGREEILTHLQVACNFKEKDKWIQAGLAFFSTY